MNPEKKHLPLIWSWSGSDKSGLEKTHSRILDMNLDIDKDVVVGFDRDDGGDENSGWQC